jgi:hypothetical protein
MRRILCYSIVMFAILATRAESQHPSEPYSILDIFQRAQMVAICRLENAVMPNNVFSLGKVDLVMEDILRSHAILKEKKFVVLPRYLEPTKQKFLVVMGKYKNEINPYLAVPLDDDGRMEKFVRGAMLLKDKSDVGRARYSVDFLEDSDSDVATAALVEVSRLEYSEFRKLSTILKPAPYRKAIQMENNSSYVSGMYAMLLGHCGTKDDAQFLRKLIDRRALNPWGDDKILTAYVLLDGEAGWQFLVKMLSDKTKSFSNRHSAAKAAFFLYVERKDIVPEKKSFAAVNSALEMADLADLLVESLRKWQRWEYGDAIFKVCSKPGFETAIMKRAVLRFALQCPTPQAKDYVKAEQMRDPEFAAVTKELLALEAEVAAAKTKK